MSGFHGVFFPEISAKSRVGVPGGLPLRTENSESAPAVLVLSVLVR